MNKCLLYILFFLYALNFNAQKIKSVSVDNDTGIQEFLIENHISANDFFIINFVLSKEKKKKKKKINHSHLAIFHLIFWSKFLSNPDEICWSFSKVPEKINDKKFQHTYTILLNIAEFEFH